MPSLTHIVASNLLELRVARHHTQEELAQKADLSVSYISMLERECRFPPLPTLEKLAAALHVDPHMLLKPNAARSLPGRSSPRAA